MIMASNELACDAFHNQINVRLDSHCWFDLSKLNTHQDIVENLMPEIYTHHTLYKQYL